MQTRRLVINTWESTGSGSGGNINPFLIPGKYSSVPNKSPTSTTQTTHLALIPSDSCTAPLLCHHLLYYLTLYCVLPYLLCITFFSGLIPWLLVTHPQNCSLKSLPLNQIRKMFPFPQTRLSFLQQMFSFGPLIFPSWPFTTVPNYVTICLLAFPPSKTTIPRVKYVFSSPAHSTDPYPDSVFKYLLTERLYSVSSLQL